MATFGERSGIVVGLVLASLAPLGCGFGGAGRNTAHLRGTITIDGRPLPADVEASIVFRPTKSDQAHTAGGQILGGKYDAPAVPKGPVKVYFSIQQKTGKMIREGSGNPYPELKNLIAPKYGSGTDLEVNGDNASQDFELKSA